MYSIDTSAILDGRVRYYRASVFPDLWEKLDELLESGRVVCTEEVLRELAKKDDEAHEWLNRHKSLLIPTEETIWNAASEIMNHFPGLVKAGGKRSAADPFVIALAQLKTFAVVTGERPALSAASPRIPDVCRDQRIECFGMIDLMERENWTFRMR